MSEKKKDYYKEGSWTHDMHVVVCKYKCEDLFIYILNFTSVQLYTDT